MLNLSSLFPLFLFFIFYVVKKCNQKKLQLPRGPPKLPFIGNIHQILDPAPHRILHQLATKYGPIMHLKLGFVSTIVVSSAEAARQIMKTHDNIFSNRPKLVAAKILGYNYTDIAFAPYGSYWRQLKKICIIELSTTKSMDSTRFIREDEVKSLAQSVSVSSDPINLAESLFALNHNIITRITFGDKFDDELRYRLSIRQGAMLAAGFQIGDFFPSLGFIAKITRMNEKMEECLAEQSDILDKNILLHIEQREIKKPEHERLIDVLLRIRD